MKENLMKERETEAIARVKRAGVSVPDSAVIAWIQTVGHEAILEASLRDIRAVANAF